MDVEANSFHLYCYCILCCLINSDIIFQQSFFAMVGVKPQLTKLVLALMLLGGILFGTIMKYYLVLVTW